MQARALAGRKVDSVVVSAAAHETEEVLLPVGDTEAENLLIERDVGMDVRHHEGNVAEFGRANCERLADRCRWALLTEDLNSRALWVTER